MKITKTQLITVHITLYLFYILSPFITWVIPNSLFNLYFIGSFFGIFILYSKNIIRVDVRRHLILFILVIYIIYLYTPLFTHEFSLGRILKFLPLLCIVYLRDEYYKLVYNQFYKLIVFISFFAIIVFILTNIGVSLPYIEIGREARSNSFDYYRLYGVVVELYRGSEAISGFGINRVLGAFTEPGHYGSFLGLILIIEELNLKKRSNIVLLIAGLCTLSISFVALLGVATLRFYLKDNKITYQKASLLLILVLAVSFVLFTNNALSDKVKYIFFERAFSDVENIYEVRSSQIFIEEFLTFIQTDEIYLGYTGVDKEVILERQSHINAFIFRYGFVGVCLAISLILLITRKNKNYYLLLGILIILIHRYWMFTEPMALGLFLILSNYEKEYS